MSETHRYCERPDCPNQLSGKQERWCSTTCCAWGARQRRTADPSPLSQLGRVAQMLEDNGVELDQIGQVKAVRLNEWKALAKGELMTDEDGKKYREATRVVDMQSASIILHPTWATGPKWELPHPADPVEVKVPLPRARSLAKGWKKALILPDPQFGFRRSISTGELDPFHDERALDVALQIAEIERPHLVVWLGDVLDFATFSNKFLQEPGFALTTQQTIDEAHSWIARFAALSDLGIFLEGNHDLRLQNAIIENVKAAFGLKRAGATPDEWPVLSVPNLLRLNELNVEYVGGYPAGATYLNDNLACIHGVKIGNNMRSAASMVVEDERVSVIFGHTHHNETRYRTRNTRGAAKFSVAHSPGCLCRIDGAVPSVKGGITPTGDSVRSWEDWQQSVTVVDYQEGDGRFKLDNTPIIEGEAIYKDQVLTSRVQPRWAA